MKAAARKTGNLQTANPLSVYREHAIRDTMMQIEGGGGNSGGDGARRLPGARLGSSGGGCRCDDAARSSSAQLRSVGRSKPVFYNRKSVLCIFEIHDEGG